MTERLPIFDRPFGTGRRSDERGREGHASAAALPGGTAVPYDAPAMARWKLISGARPFYSFPGRKVAVGWARDLERGDTQVTVSVCVTPEAADADTLPPESRDAIRSHGRSVINALLTEETLPAVVVVTPTGLEREYPPEPEPEDDEEGSGDGAEPADLPDSD